MANLGLELTIAELKAKYGKLYELIVPVENEDTGEVEDVVLILRKLDRKTFSAAQKLLVKNELQAVELFIKSLTVQGDFNKVLENFDALRTASELMIEIIGVNEGNVRAL
jgi:hypothetical protein